MQRLCEGRAVSYCLGVCWLGWWDHCSAVGRWCTLCWTWLCQRHSSPTQTAFCCTEDQDGCRVMQLLLATEPLFFWQISSPWMGARALAVECPAWWIPSLNLPAPLLSTLLCLTFQGNARGVTLITSKWTKALGLNWNLRRSSLFVQLGHRLCFASSFLLSNPLSFVFYHYICNVFQMYSLTVSNY